MDRLTKPLHRTSRTRDHTHHTTHHGRTPSRHRRRILALNQSSQRTLRHRCRRHHPPIRERNRRIMVRRQPRIKPLNNQHRTRRRHERNPLHTSLHGRFSQTLRRHRTTPRMDTPLVRRTQRQHLAPQRNTRNRSHRMSRPRTKRTRRTIRHHQSKPNTKRRRHDKRPRHLGLSHRS